VESAAAAAMTQKLITMLRNNALKDFMKSPFLG
jgi:hypothetical protein